MHVSFAGVVTQHAVDDDGNLAVREPAVRAEPRLRLHSRGRHEEVGHEADNEGDEPLDQEEPAPAAPAVDTAEVQEGKCQQRRRDAGDGKRGPEVAEADGKLA